MTTEPMKSLVVFSSRDNETDWWVEREALVREIVAADLRIGEGSLHTPPTPNWLTMCSHEEEFGKRVKERVIHFKKATWDDAVNVGPSVRYNHKGCDYDILGEDLKEELREKLTSVADSEWTFWPEDHYEPVPSTWTYSSYTAAEVAFMKAQKVINDSICQIMDIRDTLHKDDKGRKAFEKVIDLLCPIRLKDHI